MTGNNKFILIFTIIFFIYCINFNLSSNINQNNNNVAQKQFQLLQHDELESGFNKVLAHFKSNGKEVSVMINDTNIEENEDEEYKNLNLVLEESLELIKNGKYNEAFQRLEMNQEKAIELQHSSLLYHLGECYLYGEGTERDEKKAFEIHMKSANMGNPQSQREIGFFYATGRGVEQNLGLSLLYYTFAASSGDTQAAMSLAFKYKEGMGVEKNCAKGLYYYKYVASKVIKRIEELMLEDKYRIKSIAKDVRSIVASSDNEIEEDNDELIQLYTYNANNGDSKSQIAIANLFLKGSNRVKRNFKKAFKYYNMASDKGVSKGMLGFLYKNGYGVEKNNETAYNYFEEGAKINDAYSLVSLGRTYLKGELGKEKDYSKAVHYLNEAAKRGHSLAHYYLGECYLYGTGVEKDVNKALQYYQISSSQVLFSSFKVSLVQLMNIQDPIAACEHSINTLKDISEKGVVGKLFEVAHQHFENEYSNFPDQANSLSSLYYEKLAEMGYETAQINSAWIFHNHLHDSEKALKYYKWSASQNNPLSHLQMGNYYYHGYFRDHRGSIVQKKQITPNMKKAFKSYQLAASFNEPESLFNLGWMHQEGLGVAKDKHLAKRYYDLSLVFLPSGLWAIKIALFYLQMLNFVETYKDFELYGYKWDSWLIVFLLFILSTLILFRKMVGRIQMQQQNQNQQVNDQN